MGTAISVFVIIVSILLILIVLIQNSKGGGLSSSFSSSNQVMGVRKTADALEKATWGFAIALLVLSLLATPYSKMNSSGTEVIESQTKDKAGNNLPPATNPAPQGAPGGGQPAPQGLPQNP